MTILREEENKALKRVELSGSVLDLGGDKRSNYQRLFKGTFTLTTVNFNQKTRPDIEADLEKPLPVPDATYKGALMINVLEHIYEFKQLVRESARVLVPGGKVVVVVPYMFPYHPSPGDYHRFSQTALKKLFEGAGFTDVQITPLGSGLRSAQVVFAERLLPESLQRLFSPLGHAIARGDDAILSVLAKLMKKKYRASDYALGFLLTAWKPQ